MPVTTYPASHKANIWSNKHNYPILVTDNERLLALSCKDEYDKYFSNMIASSFENINKESQIHSYQNGFVNAAIEAYSKHHHLVIRPEDVWFSILTQLSIYINANAEQLRDKFVVHSGQKELVVVQGATLRTADYGKLAFDMGKIIEQNIIDPELREWIMPNFSTTTKNDEVVASVLMMGSLQSYFKYVFRLLCGLPSVTLLGECSDWEKLLARLDKLPSLGPEPALWQKLLISTVTSFINTFKAPNGSSTKDFWQKIAHFSGGGSGPHYLSGWITAFCFWDEKGRMLYQPGSNPTNGIGASMFELFRTGQETPVLRIGGVKFHRVDTQEVPPGWVAVPVTLNDNGTIRETRMVAGSVGVRVLGREGGKEGVEERVKLVELELNCLQPVTGWWIFERKSD